MPNRNTELLEATMQHINDHPETHQQFWWFNQHECGTGGCFAGWTWMIAGNQPMQSLVRHEDRTLRITDEVDDDITRLRAETTQMLGLTEKEADILFDANNTIPALQLMVKDLVNGDDLLGIDHYWKESGMIP